MRVIVNEIVTSCSEARDRFLMPGGGSGGGLKKALGFRMGDFQWLTMAVVAGSIHFHYESHVNASQQYRLYYSALHAGNKLIACRG